MHLQIIYLICVYMNKVDLALNDLQRLICHIHHLNQNNCFKYGYPTLIILFDIDHC